MVGLHRLEQSDFTSTPTREDAVNKKKIALLLFAAGLAATGLITTTAQKADAGQEALGCWHAPGQSTCKCSSWPQFCGSSMNCPSGGSSGDDCKL
jgi:hypothetical protein